MGSNAIGSAIAIRSFCKQVKLSTPGLKMYQECNSEDDLAAFKGTNKGKINGSNICIFAPCMIKTLISTETTEPLKLIAIAVEAAIAFDEEDEDGNQLAIEHAEVLANFLWLMNAGKVPPIEFFLRLYDNVLQNYMENRIKQCLEQDTKGYFQRGLYQPILKYRLTNTEDQKKVFFLSGPLLPTKLKLPKYCFINRFCGETFTE